MSKTTPKTAKKETAYTMRPLKWKAISDWCHLSFSVFGEIRVWTSKSHDGYWMFNVGDQCIDGDYLFGNDIPASP